MRGQETREWNIFKEIFSENWEDFQKEHSRYDNSYYDGLVEKMLHGVIYRHIVLTMPDNLMLVFYKYSVELYGKFFSCGARCLDVFFREVRGN